MDIKEFIKDVLKETDRIKNVAHKDYHKNDMNKWVAVIGEEYGEVCRSINDKEGKNLYTESVQLVAALILANEKAQKLKLY